MRIGILTGGGDAPGLNAVIRSAVRTSHLKYGFEMVGFLDGYAGLVQKQCMNLSLETVSGIIHRGGSILGTNNKDNPFLFEITRDGNLIYEDLSQQAFDNLKDLGIDALVVVGGDGSLTIANKLSSIGVNVVGVPKTIDNDLLETDYTFGFESAVSVATDALDRLHTTAESHHRTMVLEVMGRNSGWIALHAGLAGGADIILIPEIPWNLDYVVRKISERVKNGRGFSVIVVAEGAFLPDGGQVFSYSRLGGIGNAIVSSLQERGYEARGVVLGYLQRGGSPSSFDRLLGTRFGSKAIDLCAKGIFGKMVCLKGGDVSYTDLSAATLHQKKVPPDCELVEVAKNIGISFGDE